ncbi:hypothetical protein [Nocardioides dongxiaopingii]|uniref:hypothetical protein n=1 Tax=Nocardioides dongxiaopingii TaxID=2576036 RepID=UPI0010C770E8|nr:hypothetical protein [Nocardioides dongxiaopingii]
MTRTRRDWAVGVLAGLVGIAATAGFAVLVVGSLGDVGRPERSAAAAASAASPDEPVGQDVRAVVARDGSVEIVHRVVTAAPVTSILLRPGPGYGRLGVAEVAGVEVSAGGTSIASEVAVGRRAQSVSFGRLVHDFTVTYRVVPPEDGAEAAVEGRSLVFVPVLDLEYFDESGPVRHRVSADGEILNVACVRSAVPRPCGSATREGWEVDLDDVVSDVSLVVQLQREG